MVQHNFHYKQFNVSIPTDRRQNPFWGMDQLLSFPIILPILGVPQGYFPCFENPGTCVYPFTDESIHPLPILWFEVRFNIILHYTPNSFK